LSIREILDQLVVTGMLCDVSQVPSVHAKSRLDK